MSILRSCGQFDAITSILIDYLALAVMQKYSVLEISGALSVILGHILSACYKIQLPTVRLYY